MKNKLSVFLMLGLGSTIYAQQVITSTGGDVLGSGGTTSYSVGQVVYTVNTATFGTSSQGVQQAYEIFSVGINEIELNISLSAFPNPIADNLTLQISAYNNEELLYQLFDIQGKLLKRTNNRKANTNQHSKFVFSHLLYKYCKPRKQKSSII